MSKEVLPAKAPSMLLVSPNSRRGFVGPQGTLLGPTGCSSGGPRGLLGPGGLRLGCLFVSSGAQWRLLRLRRVASGTSLACVICSAGHIPLSVFIIPVDAVPYQRVQFYMYINTCREI